VQSRTTAGAAKPVADGGIRRGLIAHSADWSMWAPGGNEIAAGRAALLGPRVNPSRPVPLLIHSTVRRLFELHIARHLPGVALIAVQLGSGSNATVVPSCNPSKAKRF